jgi:hypothetical protein
MALPTAITGFSTAANSHQNKTQPFISSGGNVYIFGKTTTTTNLAAFKATDPETSFSAVGTDVTVGGTILWVDAFQVDDVIHVVTTSGSSGDLDYDYHTFNMATDAWDISAEAIVTAVDAAVFGAGSIVVRSDGDVIVLHQGEFNRDMGSNHPQLVYSRREGGSWTNDVSVGNSLTADWIAGGTVLGSSDRAHFFFVEDSGADAYQRTLTSANALETFPSAYSSANVNDWGAVMQGVSYVSGAATKVRYPNFPTANGQADAAELDSADAPTVTTTTDITGATVLGSPFSTSHVYAMSADDTTLWGTFAASDGDVWTQSNEDDAGWDSPAEFYDDTTSIGGAKTNIYTRGSDTVIAMQFTVGSPATSYYHEKVLSSGPATTDADFGMDAAAALTMGGESTAASPFDSDAAAALTWNGTATASSDWSSTAAATLTWAGAEVLAASATDWQSDAAATLTWEGQGFHSASWESAAAASLTWNGTATASADLDSDAAADLQWNATSTAASAFSHTTIASLTWQGAATATADLDSDAAADLTWNGAAIAVTQAAFDFDAAAGLTWNGTSVVAASWAAASTATVTWDGEATASADLQVTTLASLTWNGITTAGAAFDADALADLTWNSVEIFSAAFDSDAAASLTWTGASIATINSAFSMATTSSVTWNGAVVLAADWYSSASSFGFGDPPIWESGPAEAALQAAAQATQSWSGAQDAGAAWSATAAATVTMAGVEVAAAAWIAAAAATLTFEGQEVGGSGSFDMAAAASVTFGGEDATPAVALDPVTRDGWRVNADLARELEELDEEDIIFTLAAAVAYMEQADAY